MDFAKKKAINLTVIKRMDPHVVDILDSSSHVVVYDFEPETESWKKKGIEGSLFLFQRDQQPKYGFVVMNRLGVDNLMVTLYQDLEVSVMGDYVIYQDSENLIHGLWMYEVADRSRISKAMITYCQDSPPQNGFNNQSAHTTGLQPTIPHQMPQMAGYPPFPFQPVPSIASGPPNMYPPYGMAPPGALLPPMDRPAIPPGSGPGELLPTRYKIRQLGDLWQVLEAMPPAIPRGNLSEMDFQYRLRFLLQDPEFSTSIFHSYKTS